MKNKCVFLIILTLFSAKEVIAAEDYYWTQLIGEDQISFRYISKVSKECPEIAVDGKIIKMNIRAKQEKDFDEVMCEYNFNHKVKKIKLGSEFISIPQKKLKKFLVLGDTGCGKHLVPQNCNDLNIWPFPTIAKEAAKENVDLIVHMGDFHYSTSQCDTKHGCKDFNTWEKEFFRPAKELLKKAPFIMIRGNHEDCERANAGFHRYFSYKPYSSICNYYDEHYIVKYGNQPFIVLDNSSARDVNASGDKTQQRLIELETNLFKNQLVDANNELDDRPGILLLHKPIWGFLMHPYVKYKVITNYTMQQAVTPEALSNVELVIGGHLHTFQALSFQDQSLPVQIIVGNGGNRLINGDLPKEYYSHEFNENAKVKYLKNYTDFGYTIFERLSDNWKILLKNKYGEVMLECIVKDRDVKCS